MSAGGELDRRSFLVCAGAQGLTLGMSMPSGTERAHAANGPREITCWLLIAPDDAVRRT